MTQLEKMTYQGRDSTAYSYKVQVLFRGALGMNRLHHMSSITTGWLHQSHGFLQCCLPVYSSLFLAVIVVVSQESVNDERSISYADGNILLLSAFGNSYAEWTGERV